MPQLTASRLHCVEPKGAASPRTAVVWAVLRQELDRASAPLTVLDVGGGTGGFAVPLATAGHRVTVVDASPDALAALTRRAAEAGVADRITAVQGDGDALGDLVEPDSADLVLCHSVLEVVDDPATVVKALADDAAAGRRGQRARRQPGRGRAAPGRSAGTSTRPPRCSPTRTAAPGGRDTPAPPLRRRPGRRAAGRRRPHRRADPRGTRRRRPGARSAAGERQTEALLAFELATAALPPYRDMATQLHLLARRPVSLFDRPSSRATATGSLADVMPRRTDARSACRTSRPARAGRRPARRRTPGRRPAGRRPRLAPARRWPPRTRRPSPTLGARHGAGADRRASRRPPRPAWSASAPASRPARTACSASSS